MLVIYPRYKPALVVLRLSLLITLTVNSFWVKGVALGEQSVSLVPPPYKMVVFGDSVMWGQGISIDDDYAHPSQKFSRMVREQLKELLGRNVEMRDYSHSGATILNSTGMQELVLDREPPVHTPVLWRQLDKAVADLRCPATLPANQQGRQRHRCDGVGVVLLNGGINDVGLQNILNPFVAKRKLMKLIKKFCRRAMMEYLKEVAQTFPGATIVVTGYYPIVCKGEGGTTSEYFRNLLCSFLGNCVGDKGKLVARLETKANDWLLNRLDARSRIWKQYSDTYLTEAVKEANSASTPVLFARVEFTPKECYAGTDSNLWILKGFDGQQPVTDDERLEDRKTLCPAAAREMDAADMNPLLKVFLEALCPPAGTGHPNIKGARKYEASILSVLTPLLRGPKR